MIDFQKVCKSFGGQTIVENASVKLNKGESVGIVGPNGAGKTTLFNMILDSSEIDKGEIYRPKNIRISYLRQYLNEKYLGKSLVDYVENAVPELQEIIKKISSLEKKLSTESEDKVKDRERLLRQIGELQVEFEAFGGYKLRNRAETALTGLGFSPDSFKKPLSSFSGGWQMRASLAKVLIADSDILLLDEPSNYLDVNAIQWLYRYLRGFKGMILLISHDRYLLNMLTDITVEVNNGTITRYEGNYDYYSKEREQRLESAKASRINLNKKREQLERFIERFRYKNTKAAQVQSRIKMLEKMKEADIPDAIDYSGEIKLPVPPISNQEVMRLENISFSYDSCEWILKDINMSLNKGSKIAVVGYNGMGKTTLLKLISGKLKPGKGKRNIPSSTIIGYQAQEFGEILSPESTAYETIKNISPETSKIRNILGAFGFSDEAVNKRCSVLSGGEKIRLLFARIFANPPNLLILDEPTTHLDIRARENLQKIIKDYKGTVCFVSHDIEFIRNTAELIYEVKDKTLTKYYGGYDYYQEKLINSGHKEQNKQKASKNLNSDIKKNKRKTNAEIRQKYSQLKKRLNKQITGFEDKLTKLENEKEKVISLMMSENGTLDYKETNFRLKEIENQIDAFTQRWEKASLELENIENEIANHQI
ncbi:MAG: ATP-binding cassette domain-containing protein [Victivallales bacterium]|nr:ATP-binding cassette domain-containing protein [Victivallales bacterium]